MTNTEIFSVAAPIMAGLMGWTFLEIRKYNEQKRQERKRLIRTVLKLEQDVIDLQNGKEESDEKMRELRADIKEIITLLLQKKIV
jgi:hypothetical protein